MKYKETLGQLDAYFRPKEFLQTVMITMPKSLRESESNSLNRW